MALTHGLSYERLYTVWNAMIQRCTKENHPQYAHYGGRGIEVCARWLPPAEDGYINYKEDVAAIAEEQGISLQDIGYYRLTKRGQALLEISELGLENYKADPMHNLDDGDNPIIWTLDRRDNDLGYSPSNCLWVSSSTQNRNRRKGNLARSCRIGVKWCEHKGKYAAYGTYMRKYFHLGYYVSEEDAVVARIKWEESMDLETVLPRKE